jgi:hypothetical protein
MIMKKFLDFVGMILGFLVAGLCLLLWLFA